MNCPRCGNRLREITKAGVLVDVCDRCLGMWLDRGELEKIARRIAEVEREWDGRGWRVEPDRPEADRAEAAERRPDGGRGGGDPQPPRRRTHWTDIFELFD